MIEEFLVCPSLRDKSCFLWLMGCVIYRGVCGVKGIIV